MSSDPQTLGSLAALITAIAAIVRGEHRGRNAESAVSGAIQAAEAVRRDVSAQLENKMSAELCRERTKRIECQIAALDEKNEAAFAQQDKALRRIETAVNRLAVRIDVGGPPPRGAA